MASYLRHGHHIRPGAAHSSRSRHPGSTEMHHGEGAAPLLQHGRHSLTGSRGTSVTTTTQTPATTDTRTRAHNTHGVPARCNGVTPLPSSIVAFLLFSAMSSCSVSTSPNSAAAHTFRAPAATDGACAIVPAPSAAIPHWRAPMVVRKKQSQPWQPVPRRAETAILCTNSEPESQGSWRAWKHVVESPAVRYQTSQTNGSDLEMWTFRIPAVDVRSWRCARTTAASEPAQATRQGGVVVVQCQRKAPSSR